MGLRSPAMVLDSIVGIQSRALALTIDVDHILDMSRNSVQELTPFQALPELRMGKAAIPKVSWVEQRQQLEFRVANPCANNRQTCSHLAP